MPIANAGTIKLAYEEHGPADGPAVLLIMGLAAQLTFWPEEMIAGLTKAGLRVIAFDNRDVGLSQKWHAKRAPHPILQIVAKTVGLNALAPYTLHDMVGDTRALMDELQIKRAHLVGASMGGMIAQLLAGSSPDRVASLTSIMSTTGNPSLPRPSLDVAAPIFLNRKPARTRDQMVERMIGMWDVIGTPDDSIDRGALRAKIEASIDRCYYPAGVRRQIAAIIATGDMRPVISKVTAPTLIVHGANDRLAPVEGGRDSARTIPGARLEIIEGMGHDLPRKHIAKVTGLIVDHIKQSDRAVAGSRAA